MLYKKSGSGCGVGILTCAWMQWQAKHGEYIRLWAEPKPNGGDCGEVNLPPFAIG